MKECFVVGTEEELLPACSTSSRESNYHDSQGKISSFSQIRNALPTGLNSLVLAALGILCFDFRPQAFPYFVPPFLLFPQFSPCHFSIISAVCVLSAGESPLDSVDFRYVMALAPLHT